MNSGLTLLNSDLPNSMSHQQPGHRETGSWFNPIALRKAKIVCNFCLSECNRIKVTSESPEKGDQSCNLWIGSPVCYPLH